MRFSLLAILLSSFGNSFTMPSSSLRSRKSPGTPNQNNKPYVRKFPLRGGSSFTHLPIPLITSTKQLLVANGLGLLISLLTKSHLHLDLLGTGAFAVAAFSVSSQGNAITKLSTICISTWALKLASFLFYRATILKHDARLDVTLSKINGTVGFWIVSFLWGFALSLTHALGAVAPGKRNIGLPAISKCGLALYLVGLTIETTADWQKWSFKSASANAGLFCNAGLWGLSQHPNYLGNLMLWTGIFTLNLPNLWGAGWRRVVAAGSSLVFLYCLFWSQFAGNDLIPTNDLADAKYGEVSGYWAYKNDTPILVPGLKAMWALVSNTGR